MKSILSAIALLAMAIIPHTALSQITIQKETPINYHTQTEIFSYGPSGKGLRCQVGATPGHTIIVRLYECNPAGGKAKEIRRFEQVSRDLWWNKPGAIKRSWGRLKPNTGIRYVMTVEPKGGKRIQITFNGVWNQTPKVLGEGRAHNIYPNDPLNFPYAIGNARTAAAFRLPSNVIEFIE